MFITLVSPLLFSADPYWLLFKIFITKNEHGKFVFSFYFLISNKLKFTIKTKLENEIMGTWF